MKRKMILAAFAACFALAGCAGNATSGGASSSGAGSSAGSSSGGTQGSSSSSSSSSAHTHTYSSSWSHDETYHWHASTCGDDAVSGKERHDYEVRVVDPTYEAAGYSEYACKTCGYSYTGDETGKLTHNYSSEWSRDGNSHWHACTDAGYENLKSDDAVHTYEDKVIDPTYEAEGYTRHTCTVCGYYYDDSNTSKLEHNYSKDWSHDDDKHWHACVDAGYESLKKDESDHSFKTETVEPTYEAEGYTTHTCTVCGYYYTEKTSKLDPAAPTFSDDRSTVTYGLYPQTHVSDEALISSLDALETTESNGWCLYDGSYYAKKSATPCSSSYEFSDGTKIVKGTEYWFKCEPIEWKVLSSSEGTYSLVSSVLLDAHCYYSSLEDRTIDGKTIHLNNYEHSDIRSWLNDEFYNSAFSLSNSIIQTVLVDNSASSAGYSTNKYACNNTEDKVYLLSYADYNNADYFADDAARCCKTTDWARASGAFYNMGSSYLGNGYYWTRSPYAGGSNCARHVYSDGSIYWYSYVSNSNNGVRPGIQIKIA